MGRGVLLDTNVVIYWLKGRLVGGLPEAAYAISIISRIELLSGPQSTPAELSEIEKAIRSLSVIPLDDDVVSKAISIRRADRLKTPDAIICATAQVLRAEFWTHDARLLSIAGIGGYRPELIPQP